MTLVILIVALVALICIRMPVALALFTVSLSYILLGGSGSTRIALQQSIGGIDSFPLLAVPFFVLLGYLATAAGISERLFTMADALIGRVRAGLGYVNVTSSLMFSMMNGSALADTASLGRILIPDMVKRGYGSRFSLGLTAASSLVGPMLPPSVPAILYAVTAGVSVAGLFAASLLPALLIAALMCVAVFVYGQSMARRGVDLRTERRYTRREVGRTSLVSIPALLTPVVLLGGIFGGLFTPTEAACVAAVYLFVVGMAQRAFTRDKLWEVFRGTASTTASIMITIAAAGLYGWILTREGAGLLVSDLVASIGDNPVLFLLVVNIVMLVLGMVLDAAPAILILVPILIPSVELLGIDPLHFGVIVVLNLMIGLMTPPVGMLLFVLRQTTGYSFRETLLGVLPFLGILVAGLLVLTYVPLLSTALPGLLGH
ncbi:TRAP transporter large permease [Pseudonocardia nematodicida]|uniref:TRAP transporter large permease n=1 Tax=Pseudonocardia nematodicida TaxID=1206997 RepID=A0ABV1KG93_9PSEU